VELNDLLLQFREAESLEEQGDILHYLVGIVLISRFALVEYSSLIL
jgi:hypothetical protein